MTRSKLPAALAILPLLLAACAPVGGDVNSSGSVTSQETSVLPDSEEPLMVTEVTGNLTYRERIALPPTVRLQVILNSISEGPAQEVTFSRVDRTIENASVPIAFTLPVSQDGLPDDPLFGLRAFIYDTDGTVLFRTTSPVLVDPTSSRFDIGTITLTEADPSDAGAAGIAGIRDSSWIVQRYAGVGTLVYPAPTVNFGPAGEFYGTSSCNNYSSSFELDGSALSFSPIASTRRACPQPQMEQETGFLAVLSDIAKGEIAADGALTLSTADGRTIVARRAPTQ